MVSLTVLVNEVISFAVLVNELSSFPVLVNEVISFAVLVNEVVSLTVLEIMFIKYRTENQNKVKIISWANGLLQNISLRLFNRPRFYQGGIKSFSFGKSSVIKHCGE